MTSVIAPPAANGNPGIVPPWLQHASRDQPKPPARTAADVEQLLEQNGFFEWTCDEAPIR